MSAEAQQRQALRAASDSWAAQGRCCLPFISSCDITSLLSRQPVYIESTVNVNFPERKYFFDVYFFLFIVSIEMCGFKIKQK